MNVHRKIIALVGLGMVLIITITLVALQDISGALSLTTRGVGELFAKDQRIDAVEAGVGVMSLAIHNFKDTGNIFFRVTYTDANAHVLEFLGPHAELLYSPGETKILTQLGDDVRSLNREAEQIFSLDDARGKNRLAAYALVRRFDDKIASVEHDIDSYREQSVRGMAEIVLMLRANRARVNDYLLFILLASGTILLSLGMYIHRKISIPLRDLWKGTTEISQGNLAYRMQIQGTSDIGQLAERFNEMAQQLRHSYSELEKKLLDRTNELAAIDSVALTLSQSGNLRDMLAKSLGQILDSLAGLEQKGSIFLSEPDGETMRLVASRGLSKDFCQDEATIRIGECLCGIAAQTGEIRVTEKNCDDPRHSRCLGSGDHARINIPIKSRGIVLGVIFLYPRNDFTLKPSDLQMLDTIGAQLGLAVENLRFYAEVKESSEKFWDLFENSRDILFTMDSIGTLTAVNREAEKFSGYTKSELIGKSVLVFLTPEGAEIVKRMLNGEGLTARQMMEFEVIKRDSSHAFIELSARRLSKKQQPTGFQVSARDMTEQKLLREKLLTAKRLGAIGEVVITVRHEINNPLTTVIGNVELLLERYGEQDNDLKMRLESVLNSSLRIAEIVKKLQAIKQDKVVEYVKGVAMTDLKQE
ncbi:MAG TPA: PAS domain S-box protein [Nitrospirota bacterium]|nr:PAS domain S-box protein [Nitrospirota bacterium]